MTGFRGPQLPSPEGPGALHERGTLVRAVCGASRVSRAEERLTLYTFLSHSGLQPPHSDRPLPSLPEALGIRCRPGEVRPLHLWWLPRQWQQVLLGEGVQGVLWRPRQW